MPWTSKQTRLFQAAKHNPEFAAKVGIPQRTAAKLLRHGKKAAVKRHAMQG
jgi:hypothetical protein